MKEKTCERCRKYSSYRADALKPHKLVCLKKLTANAFGISFSTNSSVASDADRMNGEVISATDCDFSDTNNVNDNENVVLSKKFPCDICGRPQGIVES